MCTPGFTFLPGPLLYMTTDKLSLMWILTLLLHVQLYVYSFYLSFFYKSSTLS